MAHPRGARSEGESPTAGRDRTVEIHRERRGKPGFFEIERARKRAKFSIPEHVKFVGNWEVDDVERRVVELNEGCGRVWP